MAEVSAMRAQLMGAAGHRFQREPGELLRRGLDHGVIGHGMARALLAVAGDAHAGIAFELLLGEKRRDTSLPRLRHAGDQRPVDFARLARAKILGERARRKARLGNEQAAGGILVEPVHEARALSLGVAQNFQHAVEVPHGARAALHRKPHRLVEHQHVGVLVKGDRAEKSPSFFGIAALLGMLNSCSSNVTVVNIDNGFGAGFVASLINRRNEK